MAKLERSMPSAKNTMDVYISSESVITGDLQTKSNIRIEGKVQGNITVSGNIHIGAEAKVDGNVSGVDIQIAGAVKGNITATGEIAIFSTANVTGDLKAHGFSVEKGAYFKGNTLISKDPSADSGKTTSKHESTVNPAGAVK